MKLVAGLGSVEDYERFADAGVSEVFVGYIPNSFYEKYKMMLPANRREVFFYHVQITSFEDMRILSDMMKKRKVPVLVAFNALYYSMEQMEDLHEIMVSLNKMGFDHFIISDLFFLSFLQKKKFKASIAISGEFGEMNRDAVNLLLTEFGEYPGIEKIIFHRKTSLTSMQNLIRDIKDGGKLLDSLNKPKSLAYEAFFLNENCQFSGCFCNSMHCDEMPHMCLVPYEIKPMDGRLGYERSGVEESKDVILGASGCGLCNLWDLKEAGITHLKIVGRGLSPECVVNDIRAAKTSLRILERSHTKDAYIKEMKQELFKNGCTGNCYVIGNSSNFL